MTPLPIHIRDIIHLYEKSSREKLPQKPDNDNKEPKDIVTISADAKSKQTSEQAQDTVTKKMKGTG